MVEPLDKGAENVMIADGSHLPQCKILGHIAASDINGDSMAYTSHKVIEENEVNLLKNQTFHLGGNVLVITRHEVTYDKHDKSSTVDAHRTEGDVYYCSEKDLLHPMSRKALSDQTTEEMQDN